MIEFSSEHSATWLELMRAYPKYREAIFYWVKETDTVKRQDLESKEHFARFVEQYKEFIYLAYGLDENDLEYMYQGESKDL